MHTKLCGQIYIESIKWGCNPHYYKMKTKTVNMLPHILGINDTPGTLTSLDPVVAGFKLSPSEGVTSRALGLRRRTETKAIDVVRWIFIVLNQGMVQKTLKYNSTWMEGKEGRKLYKKGTHYEAMMNDTWAIKHEILN